MAPPAISIGFSDNASCDKYLDYLESAGHPNNMGKDWMHQYGCAHAAYPLNDYSYQNNQLNLTRNEGFFSFMNYSSEDVSTITALYGMLGPDTYGLIVKQTEGQYSDFQKKVDFINSDICDCTKLKIVKRTNGWTAYSSSFKDTCSFSTACYQPPIYCQNNVYYGNILLPLGIAVLLIALLATVAVVVYYKIIKGKPKKRLP